MKQKELHLVKLIGCLMKHKKLKLMGEGEELSLYNVYNMNNENAPFDKRTLERYVDELYKKEIFQKENEYYIVNPDYLKLDLIKISSKWQTLMEAILVSGEFDTYVMLRELLGDRKDVFMDDIKLKRYSDSVKEPVYFLRSNKEIIRHINEAIEKDYRIRVGYKGKEWSILPICYVISQDGIRTYLYYERKGKLDTPMILQYVSFVREEGVDRTVDKKELMKQVQDSWDIEVGKKVEVEILVRQNLDENEDSSYVINVLQKYLGNPDFTENGDFLFSGQVSGIDDFKAWLRKYIDICIVQKPVTLRDELINSLKNKIERYEVEN